MAIERNFTGYEMADFGELNYGSGGVVSGALNTIPSDGTARSGSRYQRLATATNSANLTSFPAGSIVGTTGTVTSGHHKRVSVRAYCRIESHAQNGQLRMMGFGNDAGTCTVQFGAQNSSGGFLQPGTKIGLRIGGQSHNAGAVGAYPWGSVDLTVGVWYRFLLDIDLDVGATTVLSATVRVTEDSDNPSVDFTVTNSTNIGASDNIDKFAFGYSNALIGGFARTAVYNFDDVMYIATSDADAVSGQPALPSQTHIYAIIPPTGAATNTGWSGTYADVDEYPASATDTMGSSTALAEVEFTHATGIALGYASIAAMKLYLNALVSGAGTGVVDYVLNGTAKSATLGVNYPTSVAVDPVGGVFFGAMTPAAFSATTFGIKKQNGAQATVMANIGLEVIGELAAYGSGNQIRGETQIKRGSIYDAQIADGAAIQRHKIVGLGDGPLPVFFPEEEGRDDWMIPGPPGSAASVRIPVVPVFFPEDGEDAMLMAAASSSSSGGGTTTNNYNTYLGSQVLLAELVAAASSSLDLATRNVAGQSGALFQSDYDEYLVEIIDLIPATNNVDMYMRFSTDGGATYDATAKYASTIWAYNGSAGTAATGDSIAAPANQFPLRKSAEISNSSTYGVSGRVQIFNPLSAAIYKRFIGDYGYMTGSTDQAMVRSGGVYMNTAAVNALRLLMSSGNITSGTVRVYGLTKQAQSIQNAPAHGHVLLAALNASASASLNFTSRNIGSLSGAIFQSDYDEYLVEIVNFNPATDSVGIQVRFSTDGGATWASGASDYRWSFMAYGSGGPGNTNSTGATSISLIGFANISNGVLRPSSAYMRVFNPLSSTAYKVVASHQAYWDSTPTLVTGELVGAYQSATPVNAMQIFASSGNITSGSVRVYGVVKDATYPVSSIMTGTHSSRPSAGNAGRVYLPNDGFSLGRDSGTAWETFGPLFPLTNPPTGVWSWRNQGTSTISEAKDALQLVAVGTAPGGTNIVARVKTAPATPYTITAYLAGMPVTKTFLGYGVCFRQNGAGTGTGRLTAYWWCLGNAAGADVGGTLRAEKWTSETVFSASYLEARRIDPPHWFRIADNGTNIIFSVSNDGQNWVQLHSVSRTDFMLQGPDQVGFFAFTTNGATPNYDVPVTVLSWKEA